MSQQIVRGREPPVEVVPCEDELPKGVVATYCSRADECPRYICEYKKVSW